MLNKYFVYEDFKIDLNRPELLLVKEFESLMDIKYNKCDEDKTGKLRLKAFNIFKYLFLFHDSNSPYSDEPREKRMEYSLADAGLTNKILLDPIFKAAEQKYGQLTKTRLMKTLEAAQVAVDKFSMYFHMVDYTEIDPETGKARYNIKDGIAAVSNLDKLVSGLNKLEEQVKKESEGESGIRGDAERGLMD